MTKKIYLNLIITSIFSISIYAQKSNLEPLDIFKLQYVSNPQISPDGNSILYERNFKDIMTDSNYSNIWIVNYDGSNSRPITTGNSKCSQPTWSNDGKKFLFKSKIDKATELYLYDLKKKSLQILTTVQSDISNLRWSDDDKRIIFLSFVEEREEKLIQLPEKPEGAKWNEPPIEITDLEFRSDGGGYLKKGNRQIFLISVDGGSPIKISSFRGKIYSCEWFNKKDLIISANLKTNIDFEPIDSDIHIYNFSSKRLRKLTSRFGPDFSPKVSHDGKKIAFLGFDDKFLGYQQNELYVMDRDGKNVKNISKEFDRNVTSIFWSGDSKKIFFKYDDYGITKLGYFNLSGKFKFLVSEVGGLSQGRPYSGGSFSISRNERYAFTFGNVYNPSDLGVGKSGTMQRLTNLNENLFELKKLGEVNEIKYKSSYDNLDIQGWIVTPPNFDPKNKYPLILEIHGGPFSNYGFRFSTEIQLYASKGYVVLYLNPRGSTSYGKKFANEIHHNYPNHDYDDLISGVNYIIDKGFIDEKNLFVTGGSGGGVLSSWIVGKTDIFSAAVVAKPVINWYSFVLYADNTSIYYKYWFKNFPWKEPEDYMKRSPISYVGNVKTPTMLLTGEKDYRTPISESEQFYTALKLNRIETMLVRIPNSSHSIASRPSNLIAKVNSVLYWFDKFRK
mgnify:FL=1